MYLLNKIRDVQQTFFYEEQDVEDTARASVPVVEGMDRFKAVMDNRHFDEGVYVENLGLIDNLLKVCHQRHDFVV